MSLDSLDKALRILGCYSLQQPEWGVTELSRHLGLHKSRVHRALAVMEERGFLKKNQINAKYRLGIKLFELGIVAEQDFDLKREARPLMAELSRKTCATVLLRVRDEKEIVVIEVVESANPLRLVKSVGARDPYSYGAAGKLFLAFMPEDELKAALDGLELVKYTPGSITDKEKLKRGLKVIKREGYAFSEEEAVRGVRAVAVPVFGDQGELIAALSAGLPKEELALERVSELVARTKETAAELTLALKLIKNKGALMEVRR